MDSPELYKWKYIDRKPVKEPSKAMELGTVVHRMFELQVTCPMACGVAHATASDLNDYGHRMGPNWTRFKKSNPGKLLWTTDEIEAARSMYANVMRDPEAAAIASNCSARREVTFYWECPATGRLRRGRTDWYWQPAPTVHLINDYKTANALDFDGYGGNAMKEKLARQATTYIEAIQYAKDDDGNPLAKPGDRVLFVFMVIENVPPYRVRVRRIEVDWLADALEAVHAAMRALDKCYRTGNWHGEGFGEIKPIKRPFSKGAF